MNPPNGQPAQAQQPPREPTPDELAFWDLQAQRAREAARPPKDMRNTGARFVDALRAKFVEDAIKRFGRAPSFEPFDQASAAAEVHCRAYLQAESAFIRGSGTRGLPAAQLSALRDGLLSALESFAAHACDGWQDAAAYREAERRRTEEWA